MFVALLTCESGSKVVGIASSTTASRALNKLGKKFALVKAERFRVVLFESDCEVFWAFGPTVVDVVARALGMNNKSRACGGR